MALAIDHARLYEAERQARAEAEVASRSKDEFLAILSHELRTPLQAILGWTRLLRSGKLDEAGNIHALETIDRNARAQAQLIGDILDVSRIITGRLRLDGRPVELAMVVDAAVDAVRASADAKGIHLQTLLDPDAGPVLGDPDRLQQVALNLLSNAIKFTPDGGQVELHLERTEDRARITVSDTGKGISPAFLPHVFERFTQADTSSTRSHSGLGLGLAIVRHLVELHGGTIKAESAGEGQGARFTVELPLLPDAPVQQAAPRVETPRACAAPTLDGVHVLVVDDEQDTLELLGTALGQSGARVTTAGSAAEALLAMARDFPDVLISDIAMPGEDGYALIERVRREERGRQLPAIALTAYAGAEDRARALLAGYQQHMAKPVEPNELVVAVSALADCPAA
jgi:CheY-like chemotaxis protein